MKLIPIFYIFLLTFSYRSFSQSTSKVINDVPTTVNTNNAPTTVNTNEPTTVNTNVPTAISTNGPASANNVNTNNTSQTSSTVNNVADGLLRVKLSFRQINTALCYALALNKYTAILVKLGLETVDNVVSTVDNTVGAVGSTVNSLGSTLGLSKRASNQYLGAIDYGNDVEWISQISMGTPPQSFLVVLDTASSDLWIPCIDCSDCSNKRLFDYTKSSTIQYDNSDFSITYADGSSSNVGNMKIPSQQFAIIYDMSPAFQNDVIDGVMGCGYDSLSVYQGTQTPFTNMYNQGLIPHKIFSVQLRPARNQSNYGGIFVFGGIDKNLYTGSITYAPVTYKYFWQIGIDDIEYNGRVIATYSRQKQQCIIDTATALMIVGSNEAKTLHSNMRGKYDSSSQTWQVPCNLNSNNRVSIKVNDQDIVREPISSGSSWCYSGIAATNGSVWILGGTFLKSYYAIFDQEKNQVGFATPVYSY
ncbi:29867_t:CDS:2 [Gigaspora margarita]|uniref:29867_t:CDS:1 n=1 Tax=Gigaspora margarita TaxID=4874 RepID=A0ABN7UYY4_GIGMA|nr:29867_t:CDS:2 [Gigaspora margarita]